jgi:uncharacterized membrane protein
MAQQTSNSTTSDNDLAHWKKTTNLMWIHLGIWFFFGFVVHFFAPALNKIVVFAKQQDNIDREFGVAEDD